MANLNFNAWEQIFRVKKFDMSKDIHFITANEMKKISGREPRHLGKMDSSSDVPPTMKKNGYFLLPVRNGEYALVRGNGFHTLEEIKNAKQFTSRLDFRLTTAGSTTSEAQYLFQSFNSGAIEYVIGEQPLHRTIGSRESSGPMSFRVGDNEIETKSPFPQIEVDLGLEGPNSVVLIEGKRPSKDFIIRQLFYPYRKYRRVSPGKKIIPAFFIFDPASRTHRFWIYRFINDNRYDSIELVKEISVEIIIAETFDIDDIEPLMAKPIPDTPQANDVEKIIEFVLNVAEGVSDAGQMAEKMEFDIRQSSYYRKAAEALGLVTSRGRSYELTDAGKGFVSENAEGRIILLSQLMTNYTLVQISLKELKDNRELTMGTLNTFIEKYTNVSGNTVSRRAGSLAAWLKWIADHSGTFSYDKGRFFLP